MGSRDLPATLEYDRWCFLYRDTRDASPLHILHTFETGISSHSFQCFNLSVSYFIFNKWVTFDLVSPRVIICS